MKNRTCYAYLLTLLIIGSCANDDNGFTALKPNYFPLSVGNSWDYENTNQQDQISERGFETLIISDSNKQSPEAFTFEQNTNDLAGVFTSILSTGEVYKDMDNQQVFFNGEYNFQLEDDSPTITIPLEHVLIYDANLSQEDELYVTSGEIEQNIDDLPLTFNYEINTIHKGFLSDKTVNDVLYEDIYISEINLKLSAEVFIIFSDFTILQEQNVTTITNYYAKDVGLIKSEVQIEAIFEDIPEQLDLEISDIDIQSQQNLIDYSVELDL